ncbi:MAG: 3D domain-containing protein [Candidatus Nealsonbacteria bacterium]|jgi:3D (Asp-Asp-Asp) domain-containing protein|nr:3D domain-containing protein [Candidatus Nealsonbacteria bacterium]
MDINSKFPALSGNKTKISLFFFIGLIILIVGMPFLALPIKKSEAELFLEENLFAQEKLLLFNENTLISASDPSNPELKIVKKLLVIITAYSSTPWETDGNPFITAAGTEVRDGIVANNKYSFGTKVRFPEIYGDKIFVIEDRMHWRKEDYHFDIWFPSYWEALNFGTKRTYIEVLEG